MIIYLATYPRSGNFWLSSLLVNHFGLAHSTVYYNPNKPNTVLAELERRGVCRSITIDEAELEKFPTHLRPGFYGYEATCAPGIHRKLFRVNKNITLTDEVRQILAADSEYYVIKTHSLPFETYSPGEYVIQSVRHPGASCWSYYNFLNLPEKPPKSLLKVITGDVGFGSWSVYHQTWREKAVELGDHYFFLRYEDLFHHELDYCKQFAGFLKLPIRSLNVKPLEYYISFGPEMFRKGQPNDWVKHMSPVMMEILYKCHNETMQLFGYKRLQAPTSSAKKNHIPEIEIEEVVEYQSDIIQELRKDTQELSEKILKQDAIIEELKSTMDRQDTVIRQKEEVIQRFVGDVVWYNEAARILAALRITLLYRFYTRKLKPFLKSNHLTRPLFRMFHTKSVPHKIGFLEQHPPKPVEVSMVYPSNLPVQDTDLPTISIVTPSYNQGSFIEKTILSVFNQHYPNLEYIVQDGGSTDGSTDILEKYRSRFHHLSIEKDDGQAQAINLGFVHSSGEIMAYINSDDLYLPGTLYYVGKYFKNHPEVDVIYGNRIIIDPQDMQIGRWVLPPYDATVLRHCDYIPQETLFWRRRIWEKTGSGIDVSFKYAMDWDLLLRFQTAGAFFKHLPRFLAAFRVHNQQKTTSIKQTGFEECEILRKRYFGYQISVDEISASATPYFRHAMIYDRFHQIGLLKLIEKDR